MNKWQIESWIGWLAIAATIAAMIGMALVGLHLI